MNNFILFSTLQVLFFAFNLLLINKDTINDIVIIINVLFVLYHHQNKHNKLMENINPYPSHHK
jgi:hypothetical protein